MIVVLIVDNDILITITYSSQQFYWYKQHINHNLGQKYTPEAFVKSCDIFIYSETLLKNDEDISDNEENNGKKIEIIKSYEEDPDTKSYESGTKSFGSDTKSHSSDTKSCSSDTKSWKRPEGKEISCSSDTKSFKRLEEKGLSEYLKNQYSEYLKAMEEMPSEDNVADINEIVDSSKKEYNILSDISYKIIEKKIDMGIIHNAFENATKSPDFRLNNRIHLSYFLGCVKQLDPSIDRKSYGSQGKQFVEVCTLLWIYV